ncbi:SDR family oxidoreductase [Aspergillus fischeri NRRL 181]|uniref:Oxidoreductase, short-chain dehydrogenase/reductase family n=1 Tax=Neosartorya fischeri (strain ATCC 1020 / DSM 3700 / CBS 544.65 / FGSC A1164 / JCM 1740 / NRRL 181 / WB 181) TaxID=331117 RepID=A1DI00_NEOFI|nr:oxidoreductase, short-chain dehydrogenase/reductase family [Aspergillus fischeri NRRL 181]EAW19007.1 oxidoreductase, short-chain dehydrogenase/reductase family [Aspergillus fischeri NRRL 181]
MPKTILITGCSANSIGAALALSLAKRGHHIFATARSPAKIPSPLTTLSNVTLLQLDVTSPASVAAAVRAVQDHGHGLDVLVNNAGAGYTIPLLDADLEHAKQVYETNVWGVARMIQGFADLLVANRGRVVNLSSVGAVVNTPWIGVYSSSKAAVMQISETLRLELAPLGVGVVCLMVGTVSTSFHDNEPRVVLPAGSRYAAIRDVISQWATGQAGPKGCSVAEFAESIVDDVLGAKGSGSGGLVWKGPNSAAVRILSRWCPVWLLDRMMSNGQGLDELEKSVKS